MLQLHALGATVADAAKLASLKREVAELTVKWKPEITFYDAAVFRDALLAVYGAANGALQFERQFADQFMYSGTRAALRRELERLYGANGMLANLNEKYLKAMTKALAEKGQVEAPDFREDVLLAHQVVLEVYEAVILREARENWMSSDAMQDAFGAFAAFVGAVRAIVNGAGTVIAAPGKAIAKAGRSVLLYLGLGLAGLVLLSGLTYWAFRRKRA